MSSSTTTALSRQPLVQVLRNITDPRDRRGARHSLFTVLSLAVTGVLAGCRNLTAIWEYATDLTGADLPPGRHRPDWCRPGGPGAGEGPDSSVGVDHPPGSAGAGPRHRRRADPAAGGGQVQPEVPTLRDLLEPVDLDGVVVTADAMHAQTTWRPIEGTITTTETSTPTDLVRITSYLTDDAEEAQGH